jgi:hypothetical protein
VLFEAVDAAPDGVPRLGLRMSYRHSLLPLGPGFAVDEPPDRLGGTLALLPQYEDRGAQLESTLTPITRPS